MGEGVAAHDRLVARHLDAGDVGDQPARRHEARRDDPRVAAVVITAGAEGHDDLLERAVARPFTEPVDRALHLACAGLDTREAVGHGQAEVVVAVHADHGAVDAAHPFPQTLDDMVHLEGRGIADRVGDVDGGGARVDDRLDHAAEEIDLGAGRILRRKLDVVAEVPRMFHAGHRAGEHLVLVHPQLELAVDRTRRQEDVNPRLSGVLQRLPGPVDVGVIAAGEAADGGTVHRAGDLAHALEIPR